MNGFRPERALIIGWITRVRDYIRKYQKELSGVDILLLEGEILKLELLANICLSCAQIAAMNGVIASPRCYKVTVTPSATILAGPVSTFKILWVYNNDIAEAKTLWVDFKPTLKVGEAFPVGPGNIIPFGLEPNLILYGICAETLSQQIEVRIMEFDIC